MNKESEKLLDEKESQFGCGEILDIELFDAPEFNEIIDRVGEDNELVQLDLYMVIMKILRKMLFMHLIQLRVLKLRLRDFIILK